ncbi:MAG: SDR family NAD(P)-dependent oxidoreductase [Clostridia bacterium]|nr:SDR family NAD(P)-dependent oxidoreductase [Clostridia bacterium]
MRIAVVTGASSGIGKEFVLALANEGTFDEIWAIARRRERLEELAEKCSVKVKPIPLDLADESSVGEYEKMLETEKPEVGLLVNAAGCGAFGPFEKCDLEEQKNCLKLNVIALVAMCRVTIPYIGDNGGIINVGSNSAWQPVPYQAVYGAGKSAVLNFTRALSRELRPKGIHVMCVCPGWIKTEFQGVARHDEYIKYVDVWYTADAVVRRAMKDYKKKKTVSILGHPVRRQVRLVKFLPVRLVMTIWCRQQGIE